MLRTAKRLDISNEVDLNERATRNASGGRDCRTHGRHLPPASCVNGVHLGPVVDVIEVDIYLQHLFHGRTRTDQVLLQFIENMLCMLLDCPGEMCTYTGQK